MGTNINQNAKQGGSHMSWCLALIAGDKHLLLTSDRTVLPSEATRTQATHSKWQYLLYSLRVNATGEERGAKAGEEKLPGPSPQSFS